MRFVLLVTFVVSGLLLAGLAIPLLRRAIPPNPFYGVRLRATLENRDLWYDVNARSARVLLVVGVVIVMATAVLYPIRQVTDEAFATISIAILLIGVGVYAFAAIRMARRTPTR